MSNSNSITTTKQGDIDTLTAAGEVLEGQSKKGWLGRLLPFLGPAFIASVAYVDPGNFATNIQGGAQFGYTLLWVIVASNLMAMLVQALAAKLGIATGTNLAEQCRRQFPRPVVWGMWLLMELVAMATDLAEFLGAALGFNLLFGIPLWLAGIVTAIVTFLILGLERYGFRPLEAVITALVGVVAVSYLVETILDRPNWGNVLFHSVVPQFSGAESVLLATGILGATVMPHAIFLHSALTQDRIKVRESSQLRRLFRFEMADVLIAMTVAGLAHACGAAVQLLRVVPTVPTLVSQEATTARLLPSATAALLDITEHKAQEYLEKLAAELQVNPAEVKVAVGRGDPARCIVQTARRIEADLIALATHGKKGALLFGRVALRQECPANIVNPSCWSRSITGLELDFRLS